MACTIDKLIGPDPTGQHVVSRAAVKRIVTGIAFDQIIAVAADQLVGTIVAR